MDKANNIRINQTDDNINDNTSVQSNSTPSSVKYYINASKQHFIVATTPISRSNRINLSEIESGIVKTSSGSAH